MSTPEDRIAAGAAARVALDRGNPECADSCVRCGATDSHICTQPAPEADEREALGRLVREVWVEWAREQPNPKPSWLVGWDDLGAADREVDMRIGEALTRRSQPAPRTVSAETPTCRTFDDHGGSICDRPAQFVVWGHLYEKRYKGPKCARHVPPGVFLPGGFGTPAIYEIPALGITVEAPRG